MEKRNQVLEEQIAEILNRTLEELSDCTLVKLMPGIGPQHPDVHFEFKKRFDAYRDDVSSMLARKSIEELRSDYLKSIGSVHNPLTKTSGVHFKLSKELNDIRKTRSPWFGSGWSEREHRLHVDYGVAAETVSLSEAALLLVGVGRAFC